MNQYIVLIHSGRFKSCSIANLTLFFLTEEDRNPTEIANLLYDIVQGYLASSQFPEDAPFLLQTIKDLLSLTNDTFDNNLYELLESNKFHSSPFKELPIKKIICLSEMIDYLTERNCWYFRKENLNDNQVSCEVFDTIWEDK